VLARVNFLLSLNLRHLSFRGLTRQAAYRVIAGMAGGWISDEERRILDSIEAHGWYAVHRFDPELEKPNFTYTVGFTKTLNAPEFIVFGLHRDVMFDMLAGVFEQVKAGRKIGDNQVWKGLTEDFECVGRKASHPDLFGKYATLADWYWKRSGNQGHPAVIQLTWPGLLDGLYPWDRKCRADVKAAQTKLWT
ncbi:MAG TPA: DUF4262 domain-containing protein, partial [Hyphomonas sp.]|nr:DUF4262 domain-containing protein [Hyphomonas sp.]